MTLTVDLTAKKLIRRTDLPLDWQMQKQALGFRQSAATRTPASSTKPGPVTARQRKDRQSSRILCSAPVSDPGMPAGYAAHAGLFAQSPGDAGIQETGWWAHQGSNLGPAD